MKKVKFFFATIIVLSFLSGCLENNEKVIPEIKLIDLPSSEVSIDCKRQNFTISFTSNVPWSTSSTVNWVSITPSSGNSGAASIAVEVQENTTKEARKAVLTIADNTVKAVVNITIRQDVAAKYNPIFNIDKNDFEVSGDGGDIELTVTHNVEYGINSTPEWIKQTSKKTNGNDDSYVFSIEKNNSLEAREGVIVFCNELGVCVPVNVKQTGISASLSVSPTSFFFSNKEESDKFTIMSNTSWKISKDVDWIELGTNEGNGNAGVTIIVSENTTTATRKATIKVTTMDESTAMSISVQQNGAKEIFSIDQKEFNVAANGEDFSVRVTHNIGYKINSVPDWVKQTAKSSSGNIDTYTFKAEANPDTQAREGVIVFCNDNEVCVPVTVRQSGANASLSVSPANMTVPAKSETRTFYVTSNTAWNASSSENWAKIDKTGGSGNAQVTVSVSENLATTARTATITVKTADGKSTATVKVTQNPADVIFSIDRSELDVAANGEDFSVRVTHNIGYKINSVPDWVKQTAKSSSGNIDTYTFKAEANPDTQAREGVIVFCNDNEVCVPVTVRQSGANASLSVSPANMTVPAKSETRTFYVTSNTAWNASSSENWAKIDKTGGSGNAQVTVSVSENLATTARTATITIKTADGKSTATVKVTQNPANVIFSIDNGKFTVGASGGDISIKIKHNINYIVKSMPVWVKQTSKTASGDTDTYIFKVNSNTGAKRNGEIVFYGNNITIIATIDQSAGQTDGENDDTTTGEKITLE